MIYNIRRALKSALGVTAIVAVNVTSVAAQTINLPGSEAPTSGFGKGATATYGQTFTAPTGFNYLQNFSFWLSNDSGLGAVNAADLRFEAFVMQWDAANGHATGPILFSSAVQVGPTSVSQRYNFSTTNLGLNTNTQYVAFLSASQQLGNIPGTDATAVMETSFAGTYTGGQFVFADNGADFGLLSTNPWEFTGVTEFQTHFEANFSATAVSVVPEPSSLMLLAFGASAVLFVALKRKRV